MLFRRGFFPTGGSLFLCLGSDAGSVGTRIPPRRSNSKAFINLLLCCPREESGSPGVRFRRELTHLFCRERCICPDVRERFFSSLWNPMGDSTRAPRILCRTQQICSCSFLTPSRGCTPASTSNADQCSPHLLTVAYCLCSDIMNEM